MFALLCVSLLLCAMGLNAVPTVIRVSQYGARPDGSDSREAVLQAIEAAAQVGGPVQVQFGAGRYRVSAPPGEPAITLNGIHDVTLTGVPGRTTLVLTRTGHPLIHAAGCQRVTIQDLIIDADPLPFTQGVITAVEPEPGAIDVRIDPGFPQMSDEQFARARNMYERWGMVFEPNERSLKRAAGDAYFINSWKRVAPDVWRLFAPPESRGQWTGVVPGDRYVQLARSSGGTVSIWRCKDVLLSRLIFHASAGLCIALVENEGDLRVQHVQARFARGSRRLITSCSDGVHCQGNRSGPVIEHCYFEGLADDSINIYGAASIVAEQPRADQLKLLRGPAHRVGDLLQIFDSSKAQVVANVTVTDVQEFGGLRLLTISEELPPLRCGSDHKSADTVYNLSASGSGFVIRNNTMRGHRRFAVNVKGGPGLVENNLIDETLGWGMVAGNDPDWPEGPVVRDLVIRNNTFRGTGKLSHYHKMPTGASLRVGGYGDYGRWSPGRAARGIRIEGNTFIDPPGHAILAAGIDGLAVFDNRVNTPPSAPILRNASVFRLENCDNVEMVNNQVQDLRQGVTSVIEIGPECTRKVYISGLIARTHPDTPRLADHRLRR